jgi:hypothetical protein
MIKDDISIAGLALPGHTFSIATSESQDFTDGTEFDGILGLGQTVRR